MSAARPSIVDKPLPSGKGEVSASAFAFLFSELVQYSLHRVKRTADLETRLESAGHSIGMRVLELLVHREKANRKETNLIAMLQFVTTTVWRALFGKVADGLEKSNNSEDECASTSSNTRFFHYTLSATPFLFLLHPTAHPARGQLRLNFLLVLCTHSQIT